MRVARTFSRGELGIEAPPIAVESDTVNGLPGIQVVGMPQTAVKESKDRIRPALKNAGFSIPDRKITVSLAPADLPKNGGRFDLAIAVAILSATGQLSPAAAARAELVGELSLDGSLRAVGGVLPAVVAADREAREIIIPAGNAAEAAFVGSPHVRVAGNLASVVSHLQGDHELPGPGETKDHKEELPGLSEVWGQPVAKQALAIAAAGGHNLLMVGPPGSGKSMLASRLPALLPAPDRAEQLAMAAVRSVSGRGQDLGEMGRRSFRSPHHSASAVAIVGGGNPPRPGEISLAHLGVLFLDELPEFPRHVLETLREPLESGEINISRANASVTYPAAFQLVAAMNPCPCGFSSSDPARCLCSPETITRYRGRLSGPLLDRIDLTVEVLPVPPRQLSAAARAPEADDGTRLKTRVANARKMMLERAGCANARLTAGQVMREVDIPRDTIDALDRLAEKLGLSARAYFRVLRVARTIADLEGCVTVSQGQLAQALAYRSEG